jgi:ribonuclease Z
MIRVIAALLAVLAWAPLARAETADALKVVICGSSGPLPVTGRAKTCTAVLAGGSLYLVDIGPEATENLMQWRLPLAEAKAVFITHLHSDHIGDLGEFNDQSWIQGRAQPLAVVGPAGVDSLARGFNLAYETDHGFRKAHHEHDGVVFDLAAGQLAPRVIAIPRPDGTATAWTDGALEVRAIRVAHDPASPAFAYRFDYKGRSVVISGDTHKWPPLAEAARGADVLIHEAQNNAMTRQLSGGLKALGNARMASIIGDTVSYHTEPAEAADIARAAGVKALVLNHLTQAGLPMFTPEAFAKGMEEGGKLDWRLAKDGMTIELPVGSDAVVFGSY